jgi:hypothetical protein
MTATKAKEVETAATSSELTPLPFQETSKVALYAPWGGRKTLQIGYLIKEFGAENVLVVNAERGLNTIKSKLTIPENVLTVPTLAELRANFGKVKAFATGPDKYVCLDGGSRVVSWMANEQLNGADRYYTAMKRNLPQSQEDLQYGRFIQKGEINSMAVYNKVGRESETLWNSWVGLNANVYVSFLEELTGTNGFEKTYPFGPDVPGKVGLTVAMSTFDYVGRLTYDNGQLVGAFDPTEKHLYLAKVRDDRDAGIVIPPTIPNFNLAEFFKLVRGEESAYSKREVASV